MNQKKNIGFISSELGRLIHLAVNCAREASGEDSVIVQRGWIIGYLTHHQDDIICQKDLECLFHMPKSTATDTLNVLEREGYITRVAIENDARRKRLVVTEKGIAYSRGTEKKIDEVEKYIINDISEDDLEKFFAVMEKIKANAIDYREKLKEE